MCTKNTRERNLHMRKKHPGRDLRQKGTLGRNYYSHPSGHTPLGCTAAVSGASDRGFVSGKVFRISPPPPYGSVVRFARPRTPLSALPVDGPNAITIIIRFIVVRFKSRKRRISSRPADGRQTGESDPGRIIGNFSDLRADRSGKTKNIDRSQTAER